MSNLGRRSWLTSTPDCPGSMRRLLLRPLVYNVHISQELGVARRFQLRVAPRSRARRRSPSSRCRSRLPGILSMFVDRRGYEGPEFTAEGRHHRELLYRHADQVCSGFYPDPKRTHMPSVKYHHQDLRWALHPSYNYSGRGLFMERSCPFIVIGAGVIH